MMSRITARAAGRDGGAARRDGFMMSRLDALPHRCRRRTGCSNEESRFSRIFAMKRLIFIILMLA